MTDLERHRIALRHCPHCDTKTLKLKGYSALLGFLQCSNCLVVVVVA